QAVLQSHRAVARRCHPAAVQSAVSGEAARANGRWWQDACRVQSVATTIAACSVAHESARVRGEVPEHPKTTAIKARVIPFEETPVEATHAMLHRSAAEPCARVGTEDAVVDRRVSIHKQPAAVVQHRTVFLEETVPNFSDPDFHAAGM